jgi:hypothetical protein
MADSTEPPPGQGRAANRGRRPTRGRPKEPFPLWGVIALPGGAVFGSLFGIFVGALFGVPAIGVAIGAGLGVGVGLAVLAAAIVIASADD